VSTVVLVEHRILTKNIYDKGCEFDSNAGDCSGVRIIQRVKMHQSRFNVFLAFQDIQLVRIDLPIESKVIETDRWLANTSTKSCLVSMHDSWKRKPGSGGKFIKYVISSFFDPS
jgi:hypothetical protein